MRGELEVVWDAVFDALVRSKSCDIMRLLRMFRHRPRQCDLSQVLWFIIWVCFFGLRIPGLGTAAWLSGFLAHLMRETPKIGSLLCRK